MYFIIFFEMCVLEYNIDVCIRNNFKYQNIARKYAYEFYKAICDRMYEMYIIKEYVKDIAQKYINAIIIDI